MDRPLLPVQWASPPSPPDGPWVNNRHLGSLVPINKCSGLAQGLRGPDPPGGPFPCQATMGPHPRLFYPHTTHTCADSATGRLRLPVTWQGTRPSTWIPHPLQCLAWGGGGVLLQPRGHGPTVLGFGVTEHHSGDHVCYQPHRNDTGPVGKDRSASSGG